MKKILIVEDDIDIVTVIKIALTKEGYCVETAYDGIEALEKIQADKPSLILLDIMLPRLDGHSVNLKLKENETTKHIPVIVMTGKANYKELLEIQQEVAINGYLEKPFPIRLLKEKINEITRN